MTNNDSSRAEIAIRLIEERERLGYSQRAFAREIGVTVNGLANYENGRSWVSTKCLSVAASLGLDVQYVLTGVRSKNVAEAESKTAPVIALHGSQSIGNMNGGTVNFTEKITNRTEVVVEPGSEHINEEQAFKLSALVKEIVELEAKLKQRPKSFRAVWGALNAHMKVTRYRMIPYEGFERAEKYLRKWIGRLNSMSSAPKKDETEWRKRKYAYIKINSRNDPESVVRYIAKNFNASSLTELENEELDRVYRYVAGRKRRKR